jgi:hypothetical protein
MQYVGHRYIKHERYLEMYARYTNLKIRTTGVIYLFLQGQMM